VRILVFLTPCILVFINHESFPYPSSLYCKNLFDHNDRHYQQHVTVHCDKNKPEILCFRNEELVDGQQDEGDRQE